jgi:hypothetical protein
MPPRHAALADRMETMDALTFLLMMVVWFTLQTWLLPKLGVPT